MIQNTLDDKVMHNFLYSKMFFVFFVFRFFFCDFSGVFLGGAYCILEGVLKVGRRLLEGCCIVYLRWGGGYCIL